LGGLEVDLITAGIATLILLIYGSFKGIFVGYILLLSLFVFICILNRKGFKIKELVNMAYNGGKKSFIVLEVFILIGAVISVWMASGTVPSIVYYGIKYLNPKLFILSAFIISSIVSFLIGTSFGTAGTAGIALIVMAKGGGINLSAAAGAIIAGAYFGDRCSPLSSSANLVAHLTDTELYKNIKNMFVTSIVPFIAAVIIYTLISFQMPLNIKDSNIQNEIYNAFNTGIIVLIPAFIILLFSVFKVNVKISILVSIIAAGVIAFFVQHETIFDILKYILSGYSMKNESPLAGIIKGGGILSMLKVALVVFISSAFSGIFEGTGVLNKLIGYAERTSSRSGRFFVTILISIGSAAFGCSQALAIILTEQITKNTYKGKKYELAVDIENTAVVISPLIPWNIAGLVPATVLSADPRFILFSFYLYLIPLVNLMYYYIKDRINPPGVI
jgi:NhaC family Na+:H+ antiporter